MGKFIDLTGQTFDRLKKSSSLIRLINAIKQNGNASASVAMRLSFRHLI